MTVVTVSFVTPQHLDNRPLSGQLFAILAMFVYLVERGEDLAHVGEVGGPLEVEGLHGNSGLVETLQQHLAAVTLTAAALMGDTAADTTMRGSEEAAMEDTEEAAAACTGRQCSSSSSSMWCVLGWSCRAALKRVCRVV